MPILPLRNELGLYEIRLESIGGLGANLAGKMLAESGVLGLGLNGAHFSSYGSEKKGTPVKSFVRFAEPSTDIRDHSPIERPHMIAVFHEALIQSSQVASGLREGGTILVNTTRSALAIRQELGISGGTVAVVDALGIAFEQKTRVNTSMLGAMFRLLPFLDPDGMRSVIRKTFQKKSTELAEANLQTFDRGYREVTIHTAVEEEPELRVFHKRAPAGLGYREQMLGGVIAAPGNSAVRNLSASRQGQLPAWDPEACIHCGNCDLACPDFCFVWSMGEDRKGRAQTFLTGIDYRYCKGCMKCVEACPTGSLSALREESGYADAHGTPHRYQ